MLLAGRKAGRQKSKKWIFLAKSVGEQIQLLQAQKMFKLVNPKQFARILKRREKLKNRKKLKVASRSVLATGRKRSNGRFLSVAEIETLKRLNRFCDNEILPPTGEETDQDKEILERVEKELLS